MNILTLTNSITLLRGFLVLSFLSDNPIYRCMGVLIAMISDGLDGYLARRWKMTTPFGAFLDPLMDKFFVAIITLVFIHENRLQVWEAAALISRDFAILLFGVYLAVKGSWSNFQFRSIWAGKITTTFQFFILLGLIFNLAIPPFIFYFFIVLGFLALIELYFIEKHLPKTT